MFFSSSFQDTGLCTFQNKPVKASAMTPLWYSVKPVFLLMSTTLSAVWFADNSHVEEHVVHCVFHLPTNYIARQCAEACIVAPNPPPSLLPTTLPVHQIRELFWLSSISNTQGLVWWVLKQIVWWLPHKSHQTTVYRYINYTLSCNWYALSLISIITYFHVK